MSEPDLNPTNFVRFDDEGAVTEWGTMGASDVAALIAAGERMVIGKGDAGSYVCLRRKRVRLKIDNPTRLEGASLLGVPKGSLVKIEDIVPGAPDRSSHQASGRVDLEFDYSGSYRVTVTSAKHLPAVFEVTV